MCLWLNTKGSSFDKKSPNMQVKTPQSQATMKWEIDLVRNSIGCIRSGCLTYCFPAVAHQPWNNVQNSIHHLGLSLLFAWPSIRPSSTAEFHRIWYYQSHPMNCTNISSSLPWIPLPRPSAYYFHWWEWKCTWDQRYPWQAPACCPNSQHYCNCTCHVN